MLGGCVAGSMGKKGGGWMQGFDVHGREELVEGGYDEFDGEGFIVGGGVGGGLRGVGDMVRMKG